MLMEIEIKAKSKSGLEVSLKHFEEDQEVQMSILLNEGTTVQELNKTQSKELRQFLNTYL